MKKALLMKSIAAAVLLLVLTFSATAINAPLVKADAGGIGKFLTMEIEGEGSVTSTKVKSGETWDFPPSITEKVGAGTVLLEAKASEGWEFSHWEADLTGTSVNPTEYKTEKYGYVVAVFVKITFTITAIVAPEAPNGYIETSVDGNLTQTRDQLVVTVEYGDSQTFSFYPDSGHHVSAIKIDRNFTDPAPSYTFNDVQKDWTIVVFFSADGEAYVPAGTNVPVDLGGSVSLHFESTEGGGTATQASIDLPPLLVGTSLILWDVSVSAGVSFDGIVEIALPYSGTEIQHVFRGDSLDALYSDVNADGVVDGDDVSDVANAIQSLTPHGLYDANFDVDRNGVLDKNDIHLVNEYKGTTLQSLTFWVEGNTLYIPTYLLSIFRGR